MNVRLFLFGMLAFLLSGCDFIPTKNTSNKPVSITADGQEFHTCTRFSLNSSYLFGSVTYDLNFLQDGMKVELKGVSKVEITELPLRIDALMPSSLPDIQTDHDASGKSYQEGLTYTFSDGGKAQVQSGQWVAVKEPNPICSVRIDESQGGAQPPPKIGDVRGGYRFNGGNPNNQKNWVKQ